MSTYKVDLLVKLHNLGHHDQASELEVKLDSSGETCHISWTVYIVEDDEDNPINSYIVGTAVYDIEAELDADYFDRSNSKHRARLKKATLPKTSELARAIWELAGAYVELKFYWTVAAAQRERDVAVLPNKAVYNATMLHPLEQLAKCAE